MQTGNEAREDSSSNPADTGARSGRKDRPKSGEVERRKSRKAAISYIDGMAREVFSRAVEEAESSGAVRRLEALVLSWPDRRPG